MSNRGPNTRHAKKHRGHDLYETPPEAIRALLKAEQLPKVVWDPCCGPGNIARELRQELRVVYATDLVDYHSADQDQHGWDFLMETQLPVSCQAIVFNPPYGLAAEFVAHALDLCDQVYALLRLNFYPPQRARVPKLYDRLARIRVLKGRLPMMHRHGWTGPRSSSFFDHAWFVWERRPPTYGTIIDRIEWRHDDRHQGHTGGDPGTRGAEPQRGDQAVDAPGGDRRAD